MEKNALYLFICVSCICYYSISTEEHFQEASSGIPGTRYRSWTWTDWHDTDSGKNEVETYDAIVARGWRLCLDSEIVGSECLREDTGYILSNGFFFNTSYLLGEDIQCTLQGIQCHSIQCINFKVRFLCEDVVVEIGSALFYFLLLVVPVSVLLFRLYCWDLLKRKIHKRCSCNSNTATGNQREPSMDLSVFDPPAYDELFGAQIDGYCDRNNISYCGKCRQSKSKNTQTNKTPGCGSDIEISTTECSCFCQGACACPNSNSESVQKETHSRLLNAESNSGYIDDNEPLSDEINPRQINGAMGDISIYVIDAHFDTETPPPTYSEALVILKRNEGLAATHL